MKDRVAQSPGRVLITPEDGGAPFYAVMTRADEPLEPGTALNKANLLSDSTATALGLSGNPTPNDALNRLNTKIGTETAKYLPLAGGTLSGNLTLKGSGNFGTKINLGDGDYVHISEPTDNNMEIKAKSVNFVTTASPGLTMSGVLNMGNKKITNLAAGTASTDAVTYAQLLSTAVLPTYTISKSGITLIFTPLGIFNCGPDAGSISLSSNDIASIKQVISTVRPESNAYSNIRCEIATGVAMENITSVSLVTEYINVYLGFNPSAYVSNSFLAFVPYSRFS